MHAKYILTSSKNIYSKLNWLPVDIRFSSRDDIEKILAFET